LENHVSGQSNKPLSKPAHSLKHEEVISELKTNTEDGLTGAEATSRVQEYGRNEIGNQGGVNVTKILVRQIANAMILVLLLAMGVSFGIGSYVNLPSSTNEILLVLTDLRRLKVVSSRLSLY
jgi:magnesium-transporting ATPase (P-type)